MHMLNKLPAKITEDPVLHFGLDSEESGSGDNPMPLRVLCHQCGVGSACDPRITSGVFRCPRPECLSEFAELQNDSGLRTQAPSTSPAPPPLPPPFTLQGLVQQQGGAWQLHGQGEASGSMPEEGQANGPSTHSRTHRFRDPTTGSSVEVHFSTTAMTPDMLRAGAFPGRVHMPPSATHAMMLTLPMGIAMAGLGGLMPGFDGGNDGLDHILTQILNTYQPAAQPTARDVVERLPRRRVRGDSSAQHLQGQGQALGKQQQQALDSTAEEQMEGMVVNAEGEKQGETEQQVIDEGKQARAEQQVGKEENGDKEEWARCRAGEPCSVCLSPYNAQEVVVELPCGHSFHEDCILPWLREHHTCPTCRGPLPMENEAQPTSSAADLRDAAHQAVWQSSAQSPHGQDQQQGTSHAMELLSTDQPRDWSDLSESSPNSMRPRTPLAAAANQPLDLEMRLRSIRARVRALRGRREVQQQEQPSNTRDLEEEMRQLEEELVPLEQDLRREQQRIRHEQGILQQEMVRELVRRERLTGQQQEAHDREAEQRSQQQHNQQPQDDDADMAWGPSITPLPPLVASLLNSLGMGGTVGAGGDGNPSPQISRIHNHPATFMVQGPSGTASSGHPAASQDRGARHAVLSSDASGTNNDAHAGPMPADGGLDLGGLPFFGLPPMILSLPLPLLFNSEPPAVLLTSHIPASPSPLLDLPLPDEPQSYQVPCLAPLRLTSRIGRPGSTPLPARSTPSSNSSNTATNSSNRSSSSSTSRSQASQVNGSRAAGSCRPGLARGFFSTQPSVRTNRRGVGQPSSNTTQAPAAPASTNCAPSKSAAAPASCTPAPTTTQTEGDEGSRLSCKRTVEGKLVTPAMTSTPAAPSSPSKHGAHSIGEPSAVAATSKGQATPVSASAPAAAAGAASQNRNAAQLVALLQEQQQQAQPQLRRQGSLGGVLTAPLRWLSGGRLGRQSSSNNSRRHDDSHDGSGPA